MSAHPVVTLVGTAHDAALGAVLVRTDGAPVYLDGLPSWPPTLRGRRVRATGTLVERQLAPDPDHDDRGAIRHGIAGPSLVLVAATWQLDAGR